MDNPICRAATSLFGMQNGVTFGNVTFKLSVTFILFFKAHLQFVILLEYINFE